ncbi:tetratricopeptide repeat protein [Streptomyces sp. NPDC058290]|uniref:tetratricopeptide repeat protein n=1 Tax=Streptomyces sp. NPDC058290 TaxID=3346426 RepID=UPI0036EE0698
MTADVEQSFFGPNGHVRSVITGTLASLAVGLIAIAFFVGQFPWPKAWPIFGSAVIIAGGAVAVGTLLGFIFGLPRTFDNPSGESDISKPSQAFLLKYASNANLDQISDWLTKIIVGVGLTQLVNIPKALGTLGDSIKPALGNVDSSQAFGVGLIIYSSVVGFLFGYLLTRLRMAYALALSDLEMSMRAEAIGSEIREVDTKLRVPETGELAEPDESAQARIADLNKLVGKLEKAGGQLDADAYRRLARQLKKAGQYAEAERAYLKAAELSPNDPSPLNFAGVIRSKFLNDPAGAREYYLRAISLDPTYASAMYNMACNEMRLGRTEEGLKLLAVVVSDPKYRDLAHEDSAPGGPFESVKDEPEFQRLVQREEK